MVQSEKKYEDHIVDFVEKANELHPRLSDDNAFLYWFIRANIVNDDGKAHSSLTGNGEKGIDAIFEDVESKNVYIIQSKYHKITNNISESYNDIIAFSSIAKVFANEEQLKTFLNKVNPKVKAKLPEVFKRINDDKFKLNLYYVTTGKVSDRSRKDGENEVRRSRRINSRFVVYDKERIIRSCQNYLEGVVPPIQELTIPIKMNESFHRFDKKTQVDSWIFTVPGKELGNIFNKTGVILFARNIRGYMGDTNVNKNIEETLRKEPQNFWYFNNGVTIVCESAEKKELEEENVLIVTSPQIINGQQTTRVLAKAAENDAEVLVRVMVLPHDSGDGRGSFGYLIKNIVKATNWQNKISEADLRSNDRIQVKLSDEFRKYGYFYRRKRQAKSEIYKYYWGSGFDFILNKEDIAKFSCACTLDPYLIREGRDLLFSDQYYNKIFPERRSVHTYLTFYWFHRVVSGLKMSEYLKKSIRYYAKWHVMNYAWQLLKDFLKQRENQKRFVHAMERMDKRDVHKNIYKPLHEALVMIFMSTANFYRFWCKENKQKINENDFFKKKETYTELPLYLNSRRNKRKGKVSEKMKNFKKGIEKYQY